MGLWDTLGSWASEAGNFIDNNKDWLKPVTEAGLGAYQIYNNQQYQNANASALEQQDRANYDAYMRTREWQQQQLNARNAASGGRGGGGGGSSNAARLGALANALSEYNRLMDASKAVYKPYSDAAIALLPQAQAVTSQALNNTSKLSDMVMAPKFLATLTQSKPAYSIQLPGLKRGK